MKDTLIGLFIFVIIGVGYFYLPLEWRRHKDIQHGNHLISQIINYQTNHHALPETDDEKTLTQLGFKKRDKFGWQPAYIKQNENSFEIIYQDGYEAPYLYWQSDEQQWALKP